MSKTSREIEELRAFFADKSFPKEVELHPGIRIMDVKKFLESHFAVLSNDNAKHINDVFYDRLIRLKAILLESGA